MISRSHVSHLVDGSLGQRVPHELEVELVHGAHVSLAALAQAVGQHRLGPEAQRHHGVAHAVRGQRPAQRAAAAARAPPQPLHVHQQAAYRHCWHADAFICNC